MSTPVNTGSRPDYEAEVAHNVRVIKGWMTFFGLLAIISIVVSIIGAVQYAHMVSQLNNLVTNLGNGNFGSGSGSNPFGG